MGDEDLSAIRAKRMAELQARSGVCLFIPQLYTSHMATEKIGNWSKFL